MRKTQSKPTKRKKTVHAAEEPELTNGRDAVGLNVGLVDDDAIVRAWLRRSLEESEFHVVGEAKTAAEALELVERRRPSLLLVDYRLPDRTATELVRMLRRQGVSVPVLVITASPQLGLNEAVAEAGGQGVVLKRGDPVALLNALRSVASGQSISDVEHPKRPSDFASLSPREREILGMAAAGATNPEIARRLGLGRESVKTIMSRAFTKLGARNRMEAVASARSQGLI